MNLSRPYAGQRDFAAVSTFLAQARADIHQVHHLHVGDLVWQLAHMHAAFDPAAIVRLWEAADGDLCGFVMLYPAAGFFDLELSADARGSALEADMLRWAETQLLAPPYAARTLYTLVHEQDALRQTLLEKRGYRRGEPWLYLERSLAGLLPPVVLPPGVQVRAVEPAEGGARAAVLGAAFDAPAEPERYAQLMAAPGYDRTLDIVAVAADGQFGAFALGWFDPLSKVGQFEPVGTAPAYRRQGLGRAVLLEGMRQLQQQGAERVIVIMDAAEEGAYRLYESVGLVPQWQLYLYAKTNGGSEVAQNGSPT